MGLPQTIGITRQMVLNELIKAGINRDIADDLSYRYYHNELTFKDLELIKMELKSDIMSVKNELKSDIKDLDNKIDNKFNELDNKIENVENNLNNKIDNKFNELDNKINNVRNELKADIKDIDNKIDTVRNELKSYVSNEISIVRKDISNLEKNNKWIFGLTFALWLTILGGFIALILK
ncbi:DUF1640 domain-containing protein (plasmid) [Borrelia coriaceae]|uniref:BDR-repeat family protein n=1 Tax=Borrelia coriaceae ATCC 43381 TaxID=1408429 RepID=W5T1T4_9SPIR|nr:Bdr family repetitive protein [Borrelia coriaceae]AHH11236.1 BDR-repeat family protein [Borrelia coriaceae ATCC 43381]UPA17449.1 DUF1640 domain-containing protein [Borrelia coriaceae]